MSARIRQIPLDRLVAHPDSSNRVSRTNFAKLVHNIERTAGMSRLSSARARAGGASSRSSTVITAAKHCAASATTSPRSWSGMSTTNKPTFSGYAQPSQR